MFAPAPVPPPRHHVAQPPVGGVPGLVAPASGPLLLAGQHFAAAMLFLLAGALALPGIAPLLAAGLYPDQRVAAVTHLFTLGWLTTTIFGALYQLLPVALGAPVASVRAGHVGFWTFVPGVALFVTGIATGDLRLHHAGIALVATGVSVAVGNLLVTARRAVHRDVTWAAVLIALAALLSTFALGVALLHNLHTGWLAGLRTRAVAIHLHVAVVGFALVLLVGMSHRLLPMFLLAHGVDTRWTRRAIALLASSLVPLVAGLATGMRHVACAGVVLGIAGVAAFLWQARQFHRARIRRRIDAGMRQALVALGFLAAAALLAPALHLVGASVPGIGARLAVAYVVVGLLGGVLGYVAGFTHKIVPFLAWIAAYQGRMGRERVPTVGELTSARVTHAEHALRAAGVVAMAAGALLGQVMLVRAGTLAFAAGALLLVAQLARLAWRAVGPGASRPAISPPSPSTVP